MSDVFSHALLLGHTAVSRLPMQAPPHPSVWRVLNACFLGALVGFRLLKFSHNRSRRKERAIKRQFYTFEAQGRP